MCLFFNVCVMLVCVVVMFIGGWLVCVRYVVDVVCVVCMNVGVVFLGIVWFSV